MDSKSIALRGLWVRIPPAACDAHPLERQVVVDISAYSKSWPILFPQHGAGRKHERGIVRAAWQQRIVEDEPQMFLRGLIHSDGCRILNRVNGRAYPVFLQ